jgi:molecular chaperone DnaK (HSP70)
LKDDNDFSLIITREDFEKMISKELNIFRNELKKFCEYNEQNFKEAMLTNIEMAGELMRTPCLQNIVKEVTGLSISKTIITDECIAIGCSLYGALLNEIFPIKDFNGIYHLNNYTINISINDEPISKFIGNNEYLPSYKTYSFDEKYFNSVNSKINVSFYYDINEIKNYLSSNNGLLFTYEFDCNEIEKANGGMKNVRITFLISRIGNIHIHSIESRIFEEQYMKIEINDKIYKTINSEIYQSDNQKEKMIEEFKNKEKAMFGKDRNFKNYSKSKNNILTKLYNIKNKINDNGLGDNLFGERKVNEVLDEIEMKLNSDNLLFNLDEISQHLDIILNNFISDDIKTKARELINKISDYQNKLSEEYTKLLSGGQCSLEEKQINDASNMMEHFIKRLNLILSKDELNNVQIEFEKEIKKYFN